MHRIVILLFISFACGNLKAQAEDSIRLHQEIVEVKIMKNFERKYQQRLRLMKRVYPIALHAKKMVEEHEENLEGVTKKRKQKKLAKKTHKSLKDEFSYNIRDLYIHEGELLIRLVHRETGMTVAEIIETFEGKASRKWYNGLAKLGGQNLESRYDPDGEDYLTELIILEIEAGNISFPLEMKTVDKQEFKEGMKEYRENKKDIRKANRDAKKKKRKKK